MAFNIQAAKQAGYSDDEIQSYLGQKQATMTPQEPEKKGNAFIDLLPLLGAVGGSFIPGLGTIVGGALGAGAGTLAKQFAEDKPIDYGEIAKETALGGAGGVLGKGVGFIGGKLLGKTATGLADAGENLAVRSFKPSPTQLKTFADTTGEDFGKFLTGRKITNEDDLVKLIDKYQKPFDDIVQSSNLTVDPTDVLSGFSKQIDRLNTSILPADKQKAQTLQEIASNFIDQYGSGPVPAKALTALRKEVDEGIKNFSLDQAVKGPLNITRDVLQGSLRDAADRAGLKVNEGSLKDAGVELSKLYKALEISEKQSNVGRGSMPLGITRLLGGGLGAASGGLPGAVAGMASTSAVNSPEIMSLISKFATSGGEKLGGMSLPSNILAQSIGRAGAQEAVRVPGEIAGGGQDTPIIEGEIVPPDTSGMAQPMLAGAGDTTQQDAVRQVIGSIMLSKAKSVSDIKAAYELLYPKDKPLAAEQQKLKTNAQSGLKAISTVESILAKDPNAPLKSKLPVISGRTPYTAAAREVMDVYSRLRTGAALTEQEIKFYDSQLPQPFDSPQTIAYKLNQFKSLFSQYVYGQVPVGGDESSNNGSLDINSLLSI